METNYKIRLNRILYLIGQVIFLKLVLILSENITCPFKKIFHIPCPFCGMTRAYHYLKKIDILKSLNYNILLIPLVLFILIIDTIFLYEIIYNKKVLQNFLNKFNSKKFYMIIVVLLIASMIWGLIQGI